MLALIAAKEYDLRTKQTWLSKSSAQEFQYQDR